MTRAPAIFAFLILFAVAPLTAAFTKAPLNGAAFGFVGSRSTLRTVSGGGLYGVMAREPRHLALSPILNVNDEANDREFGMATLSIAAFAPEGKPRRVPRLVAQTASRASILKFERFKKWFYSRPSVKALFSIYSTQKIQNLPLPRQSDTHLISSNDKHWNGWNRLGGSQLFVSGLYSRNEPASGESMVGFYNPATHAAFVNVGTQGPTDLYVLRVDSPPGDLPHRSMGAIRTARGLTLGMSMQEIERIEGQGARKTLPGGFTVVSYAWQNCNGKMVRTSIACGLFVQLHLIVRRNRLELIDITESS